MLNQTQLCVFSMLIVASGSMVVLFCSSEIADAAALCSSRRWKRLTLCTSTCFGFDVLLCRTYLSQDTSGDEKDTLVAQTRVQFTGVRDRLTQRRNSV